MKLYLCILSLLSMAMLSEAQNPVVEKQQGNGDLRRMSTNELAMQGFTHITAMHRAMLNVDINDKGQAVVNTISGEIARLDNVLIFLEKAAKPSDQDVKEMAKFMIKNNDVINDINMKQLRDRAKVDLETHRNILQIKQLMRMESKKFLDLFKVLYPDDKLSVFLEKDLGHSTFRVLIEIHQIDEKTKHFDPLLFTQRQAEVIFSRKVLLKLTEELMLVRRLRMDEEKVIHFLENAFSYTVTKGGLLMIDCKLPFKHAELGGLLLTGLTRSFTKLDETRKKLEAEYAVEELKKLIQEQQERVEDHRARLFRVVQKLEFFTEADLEKSDLQSQAQYHDNRNKMLEQEAILRDLKSRERAINHRLRGPRKITVHSEPYIVK